MTGNALLKKLIPGLTPASEQLLGKIGKKAAIGAATGVGANFAYNTVTGDSGGYMRAAGIGALAGGGYAAYKAPKGSLGKLWGDISAKNQITGIGNKPRVVTPNTITRPGSAQMRPYTAPNVSSNNIVKGNNVMDFGVNRSHAGYIDAEFVPRRGADTGGVRAERDATRSDERWRNPYGIRPSQSGNASSRPGFRSRGLPSKTYRRINSIGNRMLGNQWRHGKTSFKTGVINFVRGVRGGSARLASQFGNSMQYR